MKKLFISIFTAVFALFALGTATFAWFSMNEEATVNGLAIGTKSDNTFLLISMTNTTAATIQAEGVTEVDFEMEVANSKVYPSAPALTETEKGYLTVAEGHKTVDGNPISTAGQIVNSKATAEVPTNWYTANAELVTESTLKVETVKQLVSFTGYVIQKTVYITLAKGANDAHNLTVSANFTQAGTGNDIDAARVLVVTSDGQYAILSAVDHEANLYDSETPDLTDQDVVRIDMYIYYDGNDDSVYTNNAVNLTGAEVVLSFKVEAYPAE